MADALRERGKAADPRGDSARASEIYAELAELAERIGDRWNAAIALNNLGFSAAQSGERERAVELCGRSSTLRRELGDEWGMALALTNLAFAEIQLGRLSSASRSIRRARREHQVDTMTLVSGCFDAAAALAAARGKMYEAARLVGSSERLLEELDSVRHPFDQSLLDQAVESVRASLGAEADAEIQRGRELSLDEAQPSRSP